MKTVVQSTPPRQLLRYWWAALLLPVVAGGITSALVIDKTTYASFAIIDLSQSEAYAVSLASFQEDVRAQMGDTSFSLEAEAIFNTPLYRIGEKSPYRVRATSPVAQDAQRAVSFAIASLIKMSVPEAGSANDIRRADLEESLAYLERLLDTAKERYADNTDTLALEESAIVALLDGIDARKVALLEMDERGVSSTNIVQEPTPPVAFASRRQGLFAVANATGVFILVVLALIFVDIDKVLSRVMNRFRRKQIG